MTKLVKESLNEFLGGLGALNRGKMKSFKNQCDIWFKKFAPSVKYSINDKMIITVNGSLYLYKAQVNSLPGNMYIKGELNLKHATNFSDLPEKLRVDGNVYLQDTAVTRLPNNFNVGESLYLTGLDINKLPKKLYVKKNLIIKGTKINKLPSDLFVGKQLYQGDLKFNKIPIGVKGDLMQESLNEFEQGQDPYEVMGLASDIPHETKTNYSHFTKSNYTITYVDVKLSYYDSSADKDISATISIQHVPSPEENKKVWKICFWDHEYDDIEFLSSDDFETARAAKKELLDNQKHYVDRYMEVKNEWDEEE
jgi:hypothetical protein